MSNIISLEEALQAERLHVWVGGASGSGKTAFLIKKAYALVQAGMPTSGVCILAGTAEACRALRKRLAATADALAQVRVVTPADLFVEMLDELQARQATGRVPRILTRVERVILQMDMDGQAQGQQLVERLRLRGGMLKEELPGLALVYLDSPEGEVLRGSYQAVLADDAHLMDADVLRAAAALSAGPVVAAGEADGFAAFADVFPDAAQVVLEEASDNAAAQALLRPNQVESVKWRQPENEFKGVASLVREFLLDGEDLAQEDIYVAVPNRVWADHVSKAIEARKISTTVVMDGDALRGNPHAAASSALLEAYALLALAANREDVPAWRLWCACGSKTCRKDSWAALEQRAVDQGLSLARAVLARAQNPAEGEELDRRLAQGFAMAQRASQLCGHSLLKAVSGDADSTALADIAGHVAGDEDAALLFSRVAQRVQDPVFADDARRVRVGSLARMQGLNPRLVIISGAVDGFLPAKDADAERSLFCAAAAKASGRLVLSSIQKANADQAAKLRMKARRFKTEGGVKMAMLARSPFIDEAGDAAPGTVSGEQRLG